MNKKDRMSSLREEYKDCQRCSALCVNREEVVLGTGNLNAKILFVGQEPPKEIGGSPISVEAKNLLEKMLKGVGMSLEDIYYTNIVSCPPPRAKPSRKEVKNCFDRLSAEVEIVDPYLIVVLGAEAAKTLTTVKTRFSSFAKHPESPFTFAVTKGVAVDVQRPAIVTFCPTEMIEKGKVEFKKGSDLHWLFLAVNRAKDLKSMHIELLGEEH